MKKNSRKRAAILDCLRQTTTHPTAEWIYHQLKPDLPDLSLGTVYRNLALFRQEGLVQMVDVVDGLARYDYDTTQHSHFICDCCGAVIDLAADSSAVDTAQIQQQIGGQVTGCKVIYTGVCNACMTRQS